MLFQAISMVQYVINAEKMVLICAKIVMLGKMLKQEMEEYLWK